VLAVVDASAMAGTFGALAYGLQHYQAGLRWAGMLANRVATAHHADLLRQGLRDQSLWLGPCPVCNWAMRQSRPGLRCCPSATWA
jgi:cobyrinic acid a,c-diamide synthase